MPPDYGNTSPGAPQSLSSYDKKRLRDRRAQQNRRDKQESYIRDLEERVEFYKRHHHVPDTGTEAETGTVQQQLLASIGSLREENARLRSRLQQVDGLVKGWKMEDDITAAVSVQEENITAVSTRQDIGANLVGIVQPVPAPTPAPAPAPAPAPVPPLSTSIAAPAWSLLPLSGATGGPLHIPTWLERPDLAASCPPQPSSPLDLLHGTRRNYLADQIHRAIRRRALRDSECLALGWLVYLYTKWLITPTPETFARLAPFHRPVALQLQRVHPTTLDMLIWPQMRTTLVRLWERYDFAELMGFFSCCVKVRWPWGVDVLERDEDDNLRVKAEFMDTFFQESGWGLTSEFIEKYPEILEGMNVEAVRFHMGLPDISDLETWFA